MIDGVVRVQPKAGLGGQGLGDNSLRREDTTSYVLTASLHNTQRPGTPEK